MTMCDILLQLFHIKSLAAKMIYWFWLLFRSSSSFDQMWMRTGCNTDAVCLSPQMGKAEGIINDEIPNCWECPKCHKEGKTSKVRVRPVRQTGELGDSIQSISLNLRKVIPV